MPVRFTDSEIAAFVAEPKIYQDADFSTSKLIARDAYDRRDIDFAGTVGTRFVVKLRRSRINPFDFPVILGVYIPNTNAVFRLRRYNGKHWHRNKIENERFGVDPPWWTV